ncbi:MAG: hypothetical protein R3D05_06180 [Dongiaceae bacterium]
MEHRSLDAIRHAADILPDDMTGWAGSRPMTRNERLECWAQALESKGPRKLNTLFQVEYEPPEVRALARSDDSVITVAFNEPRLRAEGLAGDTMGDAETFFRVSQRQLHDAVCFCQHGMRISGTAAAANIRALAARPRMDIRPILVGGAIAASLAVAALLL